MILTIQMQSGKFQEFNEEADFFRLLESKYTVDVYFYKAGIEVARAEKIKAGYSEKFLVTFDKIRIVSINVQVIQFVTRLGNTVDYKTPQRFDNTFFFVHGSFAVPYSSDIEVAGINTERKYLLLQNQSTNFDVFLRLDGLQAGRSNGSIKLKPDTSFEMRDYCSVERIRAIGGNSSGTVSLLVVEGTDY